MIQAIFLIVSITFFAVSFANIILANKIIREAERLQTETLAHLKQSDAELKAIESKRAEITEWLLDIEENGRIARASGAEDAWVAEDFARWATKFRQQMNRIE